MERLAVRNGSSARPAQPPAPETIGYAEYTLAFAIMVGGLTVAACRRHAERLDTTDIVQLSLATYLVSRIVARERVGAPLRGHFVEHRPDFAPEDIRGDAMSPTGDGLRKVTGELILCTRCVGVWSAAGLSYARLLAPRSMKAVLPALAAGGANSLLQALHARLTEQPRRER
jgi:hypothetical protein